MKLIPPTLFAIITLAFIAAPAVQAGSCLDASKDRGYVYVTSTCQKQNYRKRSSPCYGPTGSGLVAFVTGVVASGRNDDPSPREQFEDAYQDKYGERANGDESYCYDSLSEALSARSKKIGDFKRGDWDIESVHLRGAHY